jgi:hypothetical protein
MYNSSADTQLTFLITRLIEGDAIHHCWLDTRLTCVIARPRGGTPCTSARPTLDRLVPLLGR